MRQIRISKRHHPDDWRLDPLPLDPRDPDIVRAKELDRRGGRGCEQSARNGRAKPA
jgi:hypothetical protein